MYAKKLHTSIIITRRMPIIAAGIVTKQGKIILSRQFTDISRIRVEGLLSAFPRLLASTHAKQSTFIETGSVRYVYQPIETMLLVLITTKTSNIVEDLATLRLMGRIIPEYVPALDEATITDRTFEILFAFDEVVVNGHRDNNTMEQIMTFLAMESHEEEMAKEEKRLQVIAAKKVAKERAAQIKQMKMGGGYGGGFGSDDRDDVRGGGGIGLPMHQAPVMPEQPMNTAVVENAPAKRIGGGGGMSLGKARKVDTASKILQESGAPAIQAPAPSASAPAAAAAGSGPGPVHIKVSEKIAVTMTKDGSVSSMDVKGDMSIHVADAALANVRILLRNLSDQFNFKTHAKMNKSVFLSDRILVSKDGKPYAPHQTLEIARWRLEGKAAAPLSVTCWPSGDSATIEYELLDSRLTLRNVEILIPIGAGNPSISDCTEGECAVQGSTLRWVLPLVSSDNAAGSIEMDLATALDAADYFPINIGFESNCSLAGVSVADVVDTENGMPAPFTVETTLSCDGYSVVNA